MATITASWHLLHLASTLFAPHSNNLKLFPALIFYCGSSTIYHPPSAIPSYFHRNLLTIRITHGSLLNNRHQKYFSSDFWSGDPILCKADIFHTDIKWSWYKSEYIKKFSVSVVFHAMAPWTLQTQRFYISFTPQLKSLRGLPTVLMIVILLWWISFDL